ncbi:MAG: 4-aminobutyrate--2-oxoglutarate transaminase [Candidatus Eremiobacterota bacterium]
MVLKTEIPGANSRALAERVQAATPRSVGHTTTVGVASAEGALITDVDGNVLLDFAGGIGVVNVGHRSPRVVAAVRDQAERYLHQCFQVTLYEPYVELAERLNRLTPGNFPKKTVLFNSGAEAVENAVKIARVATGRRAVVAFERGFHGRTLLALGLTGQMNPYKVGFGPFPADIVRLPYPACHLCSLRKEGACCHLAGPHPLEALFRSHMTPQEVAALIVEPVLGEGGFLVPPPGYLKSLAEICARHGIVFIADEVQTGFGRTGRWFASEHFDLEPDLVTMAKSLAGGTVLSAVTGRAELMDAAPPGGLGGTYGGSPLACRAALATLDTLEQDGLIERAHRLGAAVVQRCRTWLERFDFVGDVRGLGAMVALELVRDRGTMEPDPERTAGVLRRSLERGLILLKAGAGGNVIRFLMPLVTTDEQLAEGLDILESALGH